MVTINKICHEKEIFMKKMMTASSTDGIIKTC